MYSLIRVWIGAKLARMLTQVRVVVRTTSASDSPSTPSLYSIPNREIHEYSWTNWNSGPPASKPAARTSETTHVASEAASASCLAQRAGENPMTTAPTSGRKMTRLSSQLSFVAIAYRPSSTKYEPAIAISPRAMPRA